MSDQTFPLIYSYTDMPGSKMGDKNISLNDLGLKPGWYGLDVWTAGDNALVSADAAFEECEWSNLYLLLEPAGKRHFKKTIKTSQTISSINIFADGLSAKGLAKIEIKPLGSLAILRFLTVKGIRYIKANRGRLSFSLIFKQVRAAIKPNATFAFRANYANWEDDDASYAAWRTHHESSEAGLNAASEIDKKLNGRILEIGILTTNKADKLKNIAEIEASSISQLLNITLIDTDYLCRSFGQSGSYEHKGWDFIVPWDISGKFAAGALERLALELINNPELDAVFADSDNLNSDGSRTSPRLKPAWNKELLWCGDYIRAPLMVRWDRALADSLISREDHQRPGYMLALHLVGTRKREKLGHIPEILFHEFPDIVDRSADIEHRILADHIHRHGNPLIISECSSGILRVDWPICEDKTASIIIPTRDSPELLKNCIDSIRLRTNGRMPEIIVADNGSVRPETKSLFKDIVRQGFAKVIPCPGPFNFSKINNDARKHATGDVIVLLNDDTQVISEDWLIELVSLALRPEVGAVGSLLLYPDGTVQHGGVTIGIAGGTGDHAFRYLPGDSHGYLNLLRCRREVSAVTGACLAVSAKNFDAMSGLDEALPVTLNDIDFCLRLKESGLVNIWTPWAVLEHWESKTRGIDYTDEALARQTKEVRLFRSRWSHIIRADPNYHPKLSKSSPDYRLI